MRQTSSLAVITNTCTLVTLETKSCSKTHLQTLNSLEMISRGYVSIHVLSSMKLHDLSDEHSSTYGAHYTLRHIVPTETQHIKNLRVTY